MMETNVQEMLAGLRQALLAERTGFEFYRMASRETKDALGQQTFQQLAAEEVQHFEFLQQHYRSLLEKGTWGGNAPMTAPARHEPDSPIFSLELRGRLKEAHFEMSALAVAVQLELNGIRHYQAMAERAQSPEARRFFEELVEWESGHYESLLAQQKLLLEDYWGAAAFDPF